VGAVDEGVSDFIIGVTSLWILVPATVSLATPRAQLLALGPRLALARWALLLLSPAACLVSLAAWYRWSSLIGTLDQTLASVTLAGATAFGLARGGFAAPSTALLLALTFGLYAVRPQLLRFWPWPHLAFRFSAFCTVLAGLNAGLCITDRVQLLAMMLFALPYHLGHVWIELELAQSTSADLFSQSVYLAGTLRTLLSILLYLASSTFLHKCGSALATPLSALPASSRLSDVCSDNDSDAGSLSVFAGATAFCKRLRRSSSELSTTSSEDGVSSGTDIL